jgi:hypothetical protein
MRPIFAFYAVFGPGIALCVAGVYHETHTTQDPPPPKKLEDFAEYVETHPAIVEATESAILGRVHRAHPGGKAMKRTIRTLLAVLALCATSAIGKTHKDLFPVPCNRLWPAVKDTLRNSGKYGIIGIDNAEMTASYIIGGTLGGKRINSVVLNARGSDCELQTQTAFSGYAHNDAFDFKMRIEESLVKLHPEIATQVQEDPNTICRNTQGKTIPCHTPVLLAISANERPMISSEQPVPEHRADIGIKMQTTRRAEKFGRIPYTKEVLEDTTAYLTTKGYLIGTIQNSNLILVLTLDRPITKWIEIVVQAKDPAGNILWSAKASKHGVSSQLTMREAGLEGALDDLHKIMDTHIRPVTVTKQ